MECSSFEGGCRTRNVTVSPCANERIGPGDEPLFGSWRARCAGDVPPGVSPMNSRIRYQSVRLGGRGFSRPDRRAPQAKLRDNTGWLPGPLTKGRPCRFCFACRFVQSVKMSRCGLCCPVSGSWLLQCRGFTPQFPRRWLATMPYDDQQYETTIFSTSGVITFLLR